MRGLVAGPPPKLTDTEWKQVEALSLRRSDPAQGCPICMEHFGLRDTLILSCSHTFHRRCLESFEKFSDSPTDRCPVCRHPHYEKKEFFHGATFYREKKVKLIQVSEVIPKTAFNHDFLTTIHNMPLIRALFV